MAPTSSEPFLAFVSLGICARACVPCMQNLESPIRYCVSFLVVGCARYNNCPLLWVRCPGGPLTTLKFYWFSVPWNLCIVYTWVHVSYQDSTNDVSYIWWISKVFCRMFIWYKSCYNRRVHIVLKQSYNCIPLSVLCDCKLSDPLFFFFPIGTENSVFAIENNVFAKSLAIYHEAWRNYIWYDRCNRLLFGWFWDKHLSGFIWFL